MSAAGPDRCIRALKRGLAFLWMVGVALAGCNGNASSLEPVDPAERLKKELETLLSEVREGKLDDSTRLISPDESIYYYKERDWNGVWVQGDSLTPVADSMWGLVRNARLYGLSPKTYHLASLERLRSGWAADTLSVGSRKDFKTWARLDLLLTDAFLTMARHVHRGHAPMDSLRKEESFHATRYTEALEKAIASKDPRTVLESLEPGSIGYRNIKKALPDFLRTANFSKQYTHLEFPFRDSMSFIRSLIERFKEEKYISDTTTQLDSIGLARAIKKIQTARGLKVDGKYGRQLISSLNKNDADRFFQAAISLDRYRMEKDTLPHRYLLVNLPAFELKVMDHDTVVLESRVIIGKPKTPTPLLESRMNQIIVYPTWTIPASIIADEILPAIKRDPGYLARKGYNLYDYDGNEIDPYSVNWSKYKKGVPYKIVQGEGIGNALGIMKFNFPNEHAVYLHDTNQRSLFQNENRSLSHGCVRVQNWTGLYRYIIQQDSLKALENNGAFIRSDSMTRWLKQEKRKVIPIKDQLPIYFRYYTAAGKNGKLEIYHDVYGMDAPIRKMIEANR